MESLSRKQFLVGAAGMLSAVAAVGMVGCAPSDSSGNTELPASGNQAAGTGLPQYETYFTDLLVIGGGNAGILAAREGVNAGKKVLIVDKGPFRHNGTSGMSWDVNFNWFDFESALPAADLNPQHKAAAYAHRDGDFDALLDLVNHGQVIASRDVSTGEVLNTSGPKCAESVFYRHEMDDVIHRSIPVMDQVMITDFLVNDGKCLGAIGLHLPSGTYRVFRSKATVMASHAGLGFRGHFTVGPKGIGTEDSTGDLQMAAFRKGLTIAGAEFCCYDINAIEPSDWAHTMGGGVMMDIQDPGALYDGNKEPYFGDLDPAATMALGNTGMNKAIAKAVNEEGRGTPNGGVYVHFEESQNIRYSCTRNSGLIKQFGLDPFTDYIEALPEMYEHDGNPIVDENMMTQWAGLFDVRGGGLTGTSCQVVYFVRLFSPWAGKCAVDYIDANGDEFDPNVDWSCVDAEIERLEEIRKREVEGGKRPWEIRQMIQEAGDKGFDIYRPTAWMEEAIEELERIRNEEMPKQVLGDAGTIYNTDWKWAIENYNLLDNAEVSIRASLEREESRGAYLRPEFPDVDDENWNCQLRCTYVDGEYKFEKYVPELKEENRFEFPMSLA